MLTHERKCFWRSLANGLHWPGAHSCSPLLLGLRASPCMAIQTLGEVNTARGASLVAQTVKNLPAMQET